MSKSTVQDWVSELPLMQQSVLLSAIRGPDGISKCQACRAMIRWFRRCVLVSAFDGKVFNSPCQLGGGSFTGPSCNMQDYDGRFALDWETAMKPKIDAFLKAKDELPHHYLTHFMHAAEVLGYQHPDMRIRNWWFSVYSRICRVLYVVPETEVMMRRRLSDNELDWRATGDETTMYSK
ncbi:hypothetical protein [Nitrosomonas communis]|uniref:Uncharacterized protein n=1 Tax=Nitrosomonas communis TaxID=44574 RepID=A0A1H2ZVP6_9PROT|nr:hypothetical protein [Nitrosomonas communis]SDX20968.1 hypothetical protein SAMN05421882_10937 [Nitrosomonas communis]